MSTDGGLTQIFRKQLPQGHWQSVETWSTGQGVPDVNFCIYGVEGWIENKKALDTWKPEIKIEQVAWIERRLRSGGRVFVAIRRMTTAGPRKGAASDSLWLYRGSAIRALIDGGMQAAEKDLLIFCPGQPARWDWLKIRECLTT